MDTKIYVRDIQTLCDLHNALELCSEQLLNIVDGVNGYLDGVLQVLESQKEMLGKRLEEARERVREAEARLSSCEASQKWDEEREEYVPDCSGAASAVRAARMEESACAEAFAEGERIYGACKDEVDKYHDKGGGLFLEGSPGGEWTMRNLAGEDTELAVKRLDEIIEQLKAILLVSMGGDASSSGNSRPGVLENGPLSAEEKKKRFEDAAHKVEETMAKDRSGNIPGGNRAMTCPKCHRPTVACICERDARERVIIYKNINNSR